ncbi:hypothetical protein FPQ18DRAFT_385241 [Pyronema domesticum]|nr:hypothetical protein FPQ18DRAFT_385241 [Pyronema domesticum]
MESQNTPPSVDENAWFDQGMILDYFQNLQEENTQLRKELMATKAQEDLNIMERYNEINDLNTAQRQLQAEIAETEKLKKTIERSLWTPQIPDIELKKEDGVSDHEYRTVIKHMGELLGRFGEIERQFYEIKKGFHDTTKDLADNLALISKEYFAVYQRLEQVESSKAVTAAVTDAALAELQSGTAALMLNEDGYFSRIMRLKLTPPGIIEVFDETMYRNYVYIDFHSISLELLNLTTQLQSALQVASLNQELILQQETQNRMLMEEVEMIKQMVMREREDSDMRVRELVRVVEELRDERGRVMKFVEE